MSALPGRRLNELDFLPDTAGAEIYGNKGGLPYRVPVGGPRGVAPLDAGSKVPLANVPDIPHVSPLLPAPAPAYLKYTSDILNGVEVPIDIFLDKEAIPNIRSGASTYNASADFQTAFSAASIRNGIHLLISQGIYNLPDSVRTFNDNVHLRGHGRPRLKVGEGQAAGYVPFQIFNSHFSAENLRIESVSRTHAFYVQPPGAAPLTGFRFERLEGDGLFYLVRCDGAADRLIYDVLVRGCKNVAPVGQNSGHFMVDFGVGIQYIGNTIQNGFNTSGYGAADSKNIVVVGNVERGLQDSVALVEAACQIEDCDLANAVIQGNSFEHDIWVSGSNGVNVNGNSCRRMRITVGNADGHDVSDVTFSNNKAAQIHIANFSAGTPAERIKARFVGNTLNPSGRTLNGVALTRLVYAEGSYITELELSDNAAVSDASANAVVATRSATTTYRFFNNDFGTLAHSITGSGGKLYERGNRNRITKNLSGYIDEALTATFAITASAWSPLTLNAESNDVNGEWSGATFTPLESGTYRFSGIMTVDPDAAGSQIGFRLNRTSGAPAELARLAFLRAADANSIGIPLREVALYIPAGDVVQLEYFFTGATTQLVAGTTVSTLQITRLD